MDFIAVFLPLIGFLIAGIFGRIIGDRGAQFVTCMCLVAAAFASVILFYQTNIQGISRASDITPWIISGDFIVNWTLRIDPLSAVMMCVINIVSACVHIYSIGYMSHDKAQARFMAYLSLFTFAMLMLVTADNLLQLFFGWEGVGLASYLLIGFWNYKETANAAAQKAFIVNRVGDFGLALGIMACFVLFGSIQFDAIFTQVPEKANALFTFFGHEFHAMTLIGLLLFVGAVGKSAQLGLHTWLPDAMEGPTPVSALIHAATMVTAGVFLVARFSPLYEYAPAALMVVTIVGALTALVAATIGLTQFDIKRVIAYSTMSQLGYMFFALGVSAYGAAMFHLVTHAFFKALLFLGAGSVIHAMSDEQDMRNMGGIWKHIKFTYVLMWIGTLALAGIPPFAGFYSKDIVLESVFADHTWFGLFAYWIGIAAAFMTAFYSGRLLFMTFHGKPRASQETMDHIHESPFVMLAPLVLLAIGAVFAGMGLYEYFVGHDRAHFWDDAIKVLKENDTVYAAHHVPLWVKYLPLVAGIGGLLLSWKMYVASPELPARIVAKFSAIHRLFFRKWYFDEIYNIVFVKPVFMIGQFFWVRGDQQTIDRFGPDGSAVASNMTARIFSRFQSGFIYHYAFIMMVAVIGLLSWFMFRNGV